MCPIPKSKVYEDNHSCLKFSRLPRLTPHTKYIAMPYHWFRSKVEQLEVSIEPVSTDQQLADQFIKSLNSDIQSCPQKLDGMVRIPQSLSRGRVK